jgi:hypothetical protein
VLFVALGQQADAGRVAPGRLAGLLDALAHIGQALFKRGHNGSVV